MNKYLLKALHEFNMGLPASAPFYRFHQLSAADQSRLEERALQLEYDNYLSEINEAVGKGLDSL